MADLEEGPESPISQFFWVKKEKKPQKEEKPTGQAKQNHPSPLLWLKIWIRHWWLHWYVSGIKHTERYSIKKDCFPLPYLFFTRRQWHFCLPAASESLTTSSHTWKKWNESAKTLCFLWWSIFQSNVFFHEQRAVLKTVWQYCKRNRGQQRKGRTTVNVLFATGFMFSRACHWLYVFPRLPLVMFSCAYNARFHFSTSSSDWLIPPIITFVIVAGSFLSWTDLYFRWSRGSFVLGHRVRMRDIRDCLWVSW